MSTSPPPKAPSRGAESVPQSQCLLLKQEENIYAQPLPTRHAKVGAGLHTAAGVTLLPGTFPLGIWWKGRGKLSFQAPPPTRGPQQ